MIKQLELLPDRDAVNSPHAMHGRVLVGRERNNLPRALAIARCDEAKLLDPVLRILSRHNGGGVGAETGQVEAADRLKRPLDRVAEDPQRVS